MRREFLDQAADRDLGERPAHEHRGGKRADQQQRHVGAQPLLQDLRQRDRDDVEDETGAKRDDHEQAEDAGGEPGRERDLGDLLAASGRVPFVRDEARIDDGGDEAEHARDREGGAPAQRRHQRGGDASGERRADIAAYAVEGERAAARGRLLDQHGSADRMVDRREHPEREQRDREHNQVRRRRRGQQRQPAAGIEQQQHVAPAPAVAEPAGGEREHAEGDERRGAERDQLGIAAAVDRLETEHHGREDEDHVVVERMRPVDETDGAAARHL